MTEIKIPDAALVMVVETVCDDSTHWGTEYDCKVMSGDVVVFHRYYSENLDWSGQDSLRTRP